MAKKKAKAAKDETPEEAEVITVLCIKVLTMPRPPVAGCSKPPCSGCGQPVWLSPATAAHMVGKPHKIRCAECVAQDADDDMEVMAPTEGQLDEMIATDPTISLAKVRRAFPKSNPAKRRATVEEMLKLTKKKKRIDN